MTTPSPEWTRTPPSKPGFFWRRWPGCSFTTPDVVEVFEGHGDYNGDETRGVLCVGGANDTEVALTDLSACEWSGPLTPPAAPGDSRG